VPITYRIDEGLNCVIARFLGNVTGEELVQFIDGAFGDERIKAQNLRFNDLRGITGPRDAPELSHFASLAARYDDAKPPERSAIVVNTDIDFGMARVFIGHLGEAGDAWQVFREAGEAARWLGLPEEMVDPDISTGWSHIVAA